VGAKIFLPKNHKGLITFVTHANAPFELKGLINLALMDSDKWDKTAHAKN
jgi:hypothetical protein